MRSLEDQKPFFHFSVDDVFDSLVEVTDTGGELFKHPFFTFLKGLHDRCGVNVDLYLFYQKELEGRLRTLNEVTDAHKSTLEQVDWLRWGPHALDYERAPHAQSPEEQRETFDNIYTQIKRFAGDVHLSRLVRLHYFSESYELADYWKKHHVDALFSTDKGAIAYRLPEEIKKELEAVGRAEYHGTLFIRTNFRVENFVNEKIPIQEAEKQIFTCLEKYRYAALLTHEYELLRPEVRDYTGKLFETLAQRGIPWR